MPLIIGRIRSVVRDFDVVTLILRAAPVFHRRRTAFCSSERGIAVRKLRAVLCRQATPSRLPCLFLRSIFLSMSLSLRFSLFSSRMYSVSRLDPPLVNIIRYNMFARKDHLFLRSVNLRCRAATFLLSPAERSFRVRPPFESFRAYSRFK